MALNFPRNVRCTKLLSVKTVPVVSFQQRLSSTEAKTETPKNETKETTVKDNTSDAKSADSTLKKTKTQAQLDEELRQKMSGLAGDGGESGIEYEDGQPVSMKRSVKSNMFRYI